MWILGTAIWAIVISGIIVALRRMNKGPEMADEPLAQELAILKRAFPGKFHAIRLDVSEYRGKRLVRCGVCTTREGGYGKTFNEAMADLKIEEGKQ